MKNRTIILFLSTCLFFGCTQNRTTNESIQEMVQGKNLVENHTSFQYTMEVKDCRLDTISQTTIYSAIKDESGWKFCSDTTNYDGSHTYMYSEINDNDGFVYTLKQTDGLDDNSITYLYQDIVKDFGYSLYDSYILDEGKIVESKNKDGILTVHTEWKYDESQTIKCRYEIDEKSKELIFFEKDKFEEDEQISSLTLSSFQYDQDLIVDTTPKDQLTDPVNSVCHITYVIDTPITFSCVENTVLYMNSRQLATIYSDETYTEEVVNFMISQAGEQIYYFKFI